MAETGTPAIPDLSKLIDTSLLKVFGELTIVPMNGTIGTLARAMDALTDAEVHSEAGANGLRYYNDNLQYASYSYNAVTPVGNENPSEEGWYVIIDQEYVLTTDTEVQSGTTYYARSTSWVTIETGGGGGTRIVQTPTVDIGTYVYTGSAQGPEIEYDDTHCTITGDTKGTNIGTYTFTISLNDPTNMVWMDLTTAPKTYTFEIDENQIQIPSVSVGTYTYNGSEQGPTITNLDSAHIIVTDDKKTNAGSYTLRFALSDPQNMTWSNGTTADITHSWSIGKAAGNATLSKSSSTLDKDHLTDTVTVSDATGAVTVQGSSDSTVATATISGNTVTISHVNKKSGTAVITLAIAASTNYASSTKTISVTADFVQIYGAEWDGTSTTAWSRTDAAANFTNPTPAVNNGNGSSPFDNILPWSGMVKENDSAAGVLVKIPKYYYKWTRSGSRMKLQISESYFDGAFVSPAHADRGDGVGERDYVYVGRYHCSDSNWKSATGVQPKASVTRDAARTAIHNLGSTIWQYDYAMFWTIMMLYLVEYADWNSQNVIGYGCSPSGSKANMGGTDGMTYHTGTSAVNRTTYGWTQYRWIEGLWDNVFDWCDGIYFSGTDVYCIKKPASFSDTSGGTKVGVRTDASGYIKAWTNPTASGFEYALYPNSVDSALDGSTYIGDYCDYNASGVVLRVGGHYVQNQGRGAFYLYGNYAASNSVASVGARLQKLPSAA